MKIKTNESTDLRPEGSRIMDAPMVAINIPDFIAQLKGEVVWETSDRNAITVFKTQGMCILLVAMHKGAVMTEHTTDSVISVQLIEGEVNLETEKKANLLKQGDIVALHEGIVHSVEALQESVFLLTLGAPLEKKVWEWF